MGEIVRTEILQESKAVFCNRLALAEVFYTLCRRKGINFARETMKTLLETHYCRIDDSDELAFEAAAYKCERSVSLAGCFVLALARLKGLTAVFAKREKEIIAEMSRKRVDVPVLFLEDLI
jgi:hypothetical protein